jgi:pyruvate,water dikinase
MELAGRNVVVTGASRGIGAHLAEEFARRGAHVLVVARSADTLAAVAERIGGDWIAADLADPADVDGLVAACIERLGHVDVWVNNAGVETNDAFVHVDRADVRALARLNFEAPLMLTRDVLPHMLRRGEGHVVQMSSIAGAVPFPGLAAYSGSKAGITNFTETVRLELSGTGVGFTVVSPGPVETEMWDRIEDTAWPRPALERFTQLRFLPKLRPEEVATATADAVEAGKRFVRVPRRYSGYHLLSNAPRRLVEAALLGLRMPRLRPPDHAPEPESAAIWLTDNPPSRDWPLYTRGNVGEVFPEVVLPLTWGLLGQAAEDGWRDAFERLGLLMPGDFADDEPMVILGVFGGYCYINASFVRLLGVRAPGGTVDAIDRQFFGESDAPAYRRRRGDRDVWSSLRLGKTVVRLLRTAERPDLFEDKAEVTRFLEGYPGDDADDDALLAYIESFPPTFRQLFGRHIEVTFSTALVSGALADLCAKAGHADALVTLLGGIGDVESAAPSAAMWELARSADEHPDVAEAFAVGIDGLLDRLAGRPGAASWLERFDHFLADFGSRGPNEWDLGSDPWAFRPERALAAIGAMRHADPSHAPHLQVARLAADRERVVPVVRSALNAADRFQFDRALAATTVFSQSRERSKTTVIDALHGVRRAQRALAERIAARGGPTDRWKTCLYTPEEFPGAVADPAPWNAEIERRAELHARLSALEPPFIVEGHVPDISTWTSRDTAHEPLEAGTVLAGIAGCPGVARGRARVVLDPGDPVGLGPGDVLVAPITDPSWTPLFLAAEAVVVDVGATMSHAVIVSRELGIPCVVSAVGATQRITDGALVEVDGSAGTVTVLGV